MEQNKNQGSQHQQSGNMQNNNKTSGTGMQQHQTPGSQQNQGPSSELSDQKIQHRSDVVDNSQSGNNNPQNGEDWSNYRNRSLSNNGSNSRTNKNNDK